MTIPIRRSLIKCVPLLALLTLTTAFNSPPVYNRRMHHIDDPIQTIVAQDVVTSSNNSNSDLSLILSKLDQLTSDVQDIKSQLREKEYEPYYGGSSHSGKGHHSHPKSNGKGKGSGKTKKSKKDSNDECICPTLPPTPIIKPIAPTRSPTVSPTISPTKPPTGVVVVPTVRIMPFGDSITKGQNDFKGGYRKELFFKLEEDGYNVDFVGTKNNNGFPGIDKDHEGTGGETIQFFIEKAEEFLDLIEDPDVILLHVGTNDFGKDRDIINAIDRFDQLLQTLGRLRPNANIIATTLIVRSDAANDEIQRLFNVFVPDVVAKNAANGIKVTYLDMNAVVKEEQLVDGIHPNQEGYDDMAEAWFGAIKKVISPNGDKYNPEIVKAVVQVKKSQIVLHMSKPVSNASVRNVNNFTANQGVAILSASLDESGRKIILGTTNLNQVDGSSVTIQIIKGVTDRTEAHLLLPAFTAITFIVKGTPPTLPPGVLPSNTIRVMPLGSTLTKGVDEFPGSYRKQVFEVLTAQGWNVDFVGTKVTNRFPGMDPHHEGTTDKFITFFTRFAQFWLDKIDYPDIILLHAGIFDFVRNIDVSKAIDRYDELIQTIGNLRPHTQIIVTNLISKAGTDMNAAIQQHFNPFIEGIVTKNANNGIRVSYLDIFSYIDDSLIDQDSLLNQEGYDAMGDGWVKAIQDISTPLGDLTSKPDVIDITSNIAMSALVVEYSKPILDSAGNVSNYSITSNGSTVAVTEAILDGKSRLVTLKVSNLDDYRGNTLTVTITNVKDRVSPPNSIVRTSTDVIVIE